MIRQVKHMGQADSTSIGPTSGANARQGAAGEFGSVECNDVESGRATDTDTTPREAAATPIRVAVVDDHEMFRAGVIATLQPYFHIVGQAADVEGSIAMIADIRPDVVLLDVHVPGGEGGGGAEILAKSQPLSPASAFLALSVSDSPQDVGSVIRAGARGYVTKTITGDDLISSIKQVHEGYAVFSPKLAGFVLSAFQGGADGRGRRRAGPRRGAGPAVRPRAGGHAPDRPRIHIQGGRRRIVHLHQDRGDPHVKRAAQIAAVQPH